MEALANIFAFTETFCATLYMYYITSIHCISLYYCRNLYHCNITALLVLKAEILCYLQVVGLTDIVESGANPISLTLGTAVTEPDSADDWDLTPRPRCWYYWGYCPYETGQPEGPPTTTTTPRPPSDPTFVTATHKGTISVTVPITAAMSTTGKLVVYYIRPDGEVVADGIDFKVEECTANDVSIVDLLFLLVRALHVIVLIGSD